MTLEYNFSFFQEDIQNFKKKKKKEYKVLNLVELHFFFHFSVMHLKKRKPQMEIGFSTLTLLGKLKKSKSQNIPNLWWYTQSIFLCFFPHPSFPSSKAQFSVHVFSFQIRKILFLQSRLKIGKAGFVRVPAFIRDRKVLMCLYNAMIRPGRLTYHVLLDPNWNP